MSGKTSSHKMRADQLLVDRNLAESREKAQRLILAGEVFCGDERVDKPGRQFAADANLEVRSRTPRFVSRGGEKLDGALDSLSCLVIGLVCADLGASTGGFTHCLLERGAARVYALDVGHGQLHQQLRQDPRVISAEGVNCRYLRGNEIPEKVDFITIDVSFISALKILPGAQTLLKSGGQICCLIKPQFEAGRAQVGRGGLIRDPAIHRAVLEDFCRGVRAINGIVIDLCRAAIAGTKGNQEYFALIEFPDHPPSSPVTDDSLIQRIKDVTNVEIS